MCVVIVVYCFLFALVLSLDPNHILKIDKLASSLDSLNYYQLYNYCY